MASLAKSDGDYWKQWWNHQASASASDYSLNRGTTLRLEEIERASLRQFIKAVDPQPDDVVLDAGCGSGRNISTLSPLVKQAVGIDYSEQMLKRARSNIAQEKLSNVMLMTGDITELPFSADAFDKVVCASVLQYLDDAQCAAALREMVRVCKPGGRLILHIKNGA
jgi:ubiquinone/menaquinone biosynthesis C-methylase UbiE